MDECDVCGKPAELTCSKCFQAVYCGQACQSADHAEHSELECFHPHEMSLEQLQFEVQLEHEEESILPVGSDINNMDHEDLIGILNRTRTKRKVRRTNRAIRKQRRNKRKANRGTRVAKRGIRKTGVLKKEQGKTKVAEARERQAQRQFGTRF